VLDLARVEELARDGHTEANIARLLNVSQDTITRRKRDSAGFADAIQRGREAAHSDVSNALWRQAKKGNVAAIVWYEKTRRGMRDAQDITSNGETLKVYQGVEVDQV
jgi:IS30 family transposase